MLEQPQKMDENAKLSQSFTQKIGNNGASPARNTQSSLNVIKRNSSGLHADLVGDINHYKSLRSKSPLVNPNPRKGHLELAPVPVKDQRLVAKKMVFIIERSNIFYQGWKIGSTLLAFTSSFTYAFLAAFIHRMNEDEIKRANIEDTIYNVLFVMDLILQFFVERTVDDDSIPSKDHKKIALAYMKGTFVMDFLTIIPF